MMAVIGRPREFDREGALGAAMRLFWRKGFSSTSMTDLCEAMGIGSPSLYAAFGNKEALYLQAMDHYVRTVGPVIWNGLSEGATARAGVESFLMAATENLPEAGGVPAGCMAMLAAVGDEWPGAIAEAASGIRLESLGNFKSRLREAVADGELPASANIDRLSRFYLCVFEGMAIQAKDGASREELKDIAETAMAAWPAAEVGR
jgi:AcrR family transcriptional regulator